MNYNYGSQRIVHVVTITESHRRYWWACAACKDEGGPFDMWEFAHDSAIFHTQESVAIAA